MYGAETIIGLKRVALTRDCDILARLECAAHMLLRGLWNFHDNPCAMPKMLILWAQ